MEMPDDPKRISEELVVAVSTHHKLNIATHLKTVKMYLDPILDNRALYQLVVEVTDLCQGEEAENADAMDSLLQFIVQQIKPEDWSNSETCDLIEWMANGHGLFMATTTPNGKTLSVPMHEVLMSIQNKIDRMSGQSRIYVEYCRDIVFVNFVRVCKLALEYEHPRLSTLIAKSLNQIELLRDLPYTSVNRQMSTSTRKMTQSMADMMFKIGKNVIGDAANENMVPVTDKQLKRIEKFISSITPQLKGVCETVDASIATASDDDLADRMSETLGKVVSMNIGTLMKTSLSKDLQEDSDEDDIPPPDKKFRS